MDRKGIIIGTGDRKRLHAVHEGALQVLASGKACDLEADNEGGLHGAQMGINRPVRFRGEIAGVIGISGEPKKVSQFADLVVMTADLMIENAAVMSENHWSMRQRENIISEMIHGEAGKDSLFGIRTRQLGINPDLPRVAILVSIKNGQGNDLSIDEVEHIQYLLRKGHPDDLVALICPTQSVLLHPVNAQVRWHPDQLTSYLHALEKRLSALKGVDFKIALGRYIQGLEGIPLSYQSAQEAYQLGMQLAPEKVIFRYADFQLDSLMLDQLHSWKGKELQAHIRPLLVSDTKGLLRKTLRAFIDSQANPGQAAKKLHIHRNTLAYRLDQIQSLTHRNPRDFSDLLLLHFALRMHELLEYQLDFSLLTVKQVSEVGITCIQGLCVSTKK